VKLSLWSLQSKATRVKDFDTAWKQFATMLLPKYKNPPHPENVQVFKSLVISETDKIKLFFKPLF